MIITSKQRWALAFIIDKDRTEGYTCMGIKAMTLSFHIEKRGSALRIIALY